jgi:4-hydroxybenzoate polyprenyltransferase
MQLAIAILNDFCDRRADEQSKKQKPIPLGLITPREALCLGLLCIVLMLILLFPLNRLALLISLLYLALGLGYNLGLKATPLSGVVFALAIPLIPVYAFVGANRFAPFLGWFIPIAALLGVAINLANSLPDIEEDRTSKVYTLAVVLGIQSTYLVCTLCLLLGAAVIGFLTFTQVVPAQNPLILSLLVIACPGILIAYVFFRARQEKYLRQRYFYVVVCTGLLLAVGWLIGVLI